MTGLFSRRDFIERCSRSGAAFLSVGIAAGACDKNKPATENKKSPESCDDFSDVSESELEKRNKLAYVKQAPEAGKECNKCKLFLPPKPEEKCGGCMLFKGPVDSNGSCTYWAPLDQEG